MDQEKLKILQMLEHGKINSYEAMELILAIDEDNNPANMNFTRLKRKGKKLKIVIDSGDKKRDILVGIDEIFISALMNRINTELKYNGISLSTDDLRLIKDKILSGRKIRLEKEQMIVSLSVD